MRHCCIFSLKSKAVEGFVVYSIKMAMQDASFTSFMCGGDVILASFSAHTRFFSIDRYYIFENMDCSIFIIKNSATKCNIVLKVLDHPAHFQHRWIESQLILILSRFSFRLILCKLALKHLHRLSLLFSFWMLTIMFFRARGVCMSTVS